MMREVEEGVFEVSQYDDFPGDIFDCEIDHMESNTESVPKEHMTIGIHIELHISKDCEREG